MTIHLLKAQKAITKSDNSLSTKKDLQYGRLPMLPHKANIVTSVQQLVQSFYLWYTQLEYSAQLLSSAHSS